MMNANGSRTATVEALTAEVRALMVGSRQITLSVYRQLDTVPVDRIEPFGRVRDDRHKSFQYGDIQLVGRDSKDGSLVRADVPRPEWADIDPVPPAFIHWCRHEIHPSVGSFVPVGHDGNHTLTWQYAVNKGNGSYSSSSYCHCGSDPAILKEEWQPVAEEQLEYLASEQVRYDEMAALPLIVLAGLK